MIGGAAVSGALDAPAAAAACGDGEGSNSFASSAWADDASASVVSGSGRFFSATALVLVLDTSRKDDGSCFTPKAANFGDRLPDVSGLTVALAVVAIISDALGLSLAEAAAAAGNLGDD